MGCYGISPAGQTAKSIVSHPMFTEQKFWCGYIRKYSTQRNSVWPFWLKHCLCGRSQCKHQLCHCQRFILYYNCIETGSSGHPVHNHHQSSIHTSFVFPGKKIDHHSNLSVPHDFIYHGGHPRLPMFQEEKPQPIQFLLFIIQALHI